MKFKIILLLLLFTSLLINGQKVSGNCNNGYGVYKYSNGTYSGYWKNGRNHGNGTYSWNSGNKYKGDWKNGNRTGQGTFSWEDGDTYTGDFLDGKRTGTGTIIWNNGNTYTGDFLDGKRHGKGSFSWNDGDHIKTGVWKNGEETEEMEHVRVEFKRFNSNALKTSNYDDSDDFNFFEKYDSFNCKFKLYEDKVLINEQLFEIDRILSESGFLSKTIHIKLVENSEVSRPEASRFAITISSYYVDIYSRCSEMIVDYDIFGEIESIKTNHYSYVGSKVYFWRKHVIASSYLIKSSEEKENNKVKW